MKVRDASPADCPAIAAIYNDAVANTTAIWNEVTVDEGNRVAWLAERTSAGFPVLVAEDESGVVCGYASFGPWRAWDGYRHTVEHSVYVDRDRRGEGVGKRLMVALIERARAARMHVMVAGIEAGNTASIALHRSLGFEAAGVVRHAGAKFGRWLDLAFLQLILDDRERP